MSDTRAGDAPDEIDEIDEIDAIGAIDAARERVVARQSDEPHDAKVSSRLNWLRAGVLGANDGIVSTAGVVVGFAGATSNRGAIILAGIAALAAGALSMAAGEYVSVSTQRDSERALLKLERQELADDPDGELAELAEMYEHKGLSHDLARQVAVELTAKDPFAAHADIELGIDPDDLTNPWAAAVASMGAFIVGALLPLLTITFAPENLRTFVTFAAVAVALVLTGWASARLGRSPAPRAIARNVAGGMLAMVITYAIGAVVGLNLG